MKVLKFEKKGELEVAAAKPMTLQERILQIDHIQARRFAKLQGAAVDIASKVSSGTFGHVQRWM